MHELVYNDFRPCRATRKEYSHWSHWHGLFLQTILGLQGSKYRTAGRRSWWPAKYFLARTNPNFGRSRYYNIYIYIFCLMEYRITLAIDRCSAFTFSFLAASRWKIHSHVLEFLSAVFARFHVRYTLSIIVRRCLKSPRVVPYLHIGKTWSFSLPGTWSKVSSTKKNNTKYFR